MKNRILKNITFTALFSLAMFMLMFVALLVAAIVVFVLVHIGVKSIPKDSPVEFWVPLMLMAVVSLAVGLIGSVFASKIPMNPFNKLIAQMNRLAAGDFGTRLDFGKKLSSNPAFYGISESFNKMAEELEHTEVFRGDFINNFSHEFKTPIVSIAGFAKLLRKGNLTEKQKEEYLTIIEEESLRLASMATNMLNLTRVENQIILTDISSFNLSEQLRSCILLLEDKWEKKQIDFKIDFEEHMISGNEELLKQAWINLLDNAIKFSPESGVIELHITMGKGTVNVAIINSGEEIPPSAQARIFNKFYQADTSHSVEGNEIGLAIVKRVAKLHGGSITVQSRNGCTVFTVAISTKIEEKTGE